MFTTIQGNILFFERTSVSICKTVPVGHTVKFQMTRDFKVLRGFKT